MQKLRPVPWQVWLITAVASLITAAAVSGQHWVEVTGADDSGLLYPVLVAIVPVFTWIATGIADSILLVRRSRARQHAEQLRTGWAKRVTTSFGWVLGMFILAVVLVGLIWLAVDVWIGNASPTYSGAGDEFAFPRTIAITVGLVFAPGLASAVPAVLMSSSSGPVEDL
ncbi:MULTISPECIES: hypothetical protein [Gulosibacter]|uniref:hypothetical protein n=1 Tax=Gulosibacter TaxID=256818 RepID=UPI000F6356F2|nr:MULTISPECIES: hypothetical protein [Gulosibacter]